jgi:murein DD-endopeptidase MepM/ murein hydrolase activator NlpD
MGDNKKITALLLAAGGLCMTGALPAGAPGRQAATRCSLIGYYTPHGVLVPVGRLAAGPFVDGYVSSGWGWRKHPLLRRVAFHAGVDVAARAGSPLYASSDGVVEQARWNGRSGNWLLVRYGWGLEVGYSHLRGFGPGIRAGARVQRGDVLGAVGSTGLSTGPHVDVRIYVHRERMEPACWCRPVMPRERTRSTVLVGG